MPIPDRPVAAAAIETEWGQAVHDYTFAPSGARVHSSVANTNIGTTFSQVSLNVVDDDPGGYLDAAFHRIEIPAGHEGLYTVHLRALTVNGSAGAGNQTRVSLRINGTDQTYGNEDNAGAVNVPVTVTWVGELAAGDLITVFAQRKGAGSNVDVIVSSLILYRIGAELGA